MKNIFLIILMLFCTFLNAQNKQETDLWSGSYAIYPNKDDVAADTLVIKKINDLTADQVPSKLEADLARWDILSTRDSKKEAVTVRRFLSNNEDDEYKEFGWTAMHKAGKMNCIDGGHFFICQTEAKTTVELKGDKPFYTETGIFGVWLHYGLVTIKKIK